MDESAIRLRNARRDRILNNQSSRLNQITSLVSGTPSTESMNDDIISQSPGLGSPQSSPVLKKMSSNIAFEHSITDTRLSPSIHSKGSKIDSSVNESNHPSLNESFISEDSLLSSSNRLIRNMSPFSSIPGGGEGFDQIDSLESSTYLSNTPLIPSSILNSLSDPSGLGLLNFQKTSSEPSSPTSPDLAFLATIKLKHSQFTTLATLFSVLFYFLILNRFITFIGIELATLNQFYFFIIFLMTLVMESFYLKFFIVS